MAHAGLTAALFSGGIDSLALAAWKKPDRLLTIDYGQLTAPSEISAAGILAGRLGILHEVLQVDLKAVGAGSLAGAPALPESEHGDWWPYRNQQLVTIGAAWAIQEGVGRLLIGTVESDSCFADGTPQFLEAINRLLALQEGSIVVEAPAIGMSAIELVGNSGVSTDLFPLCFSCNRGTRPCGLCRGCNKYREIAEHFGLQLG